jgi:hypothetical protein
MSWTFAGGFVFAVPLRDDPRGDRRDGESSAWAV